MKKTTIIAEAGVNHNGFKSIGRKLIDAAKRAGADCIKFQTYKSNKLTTKNAKRFWSWEGEKKKKGTHGKHGARPVRGAILHGRRSTI